MKWIPFTAHVRVRPSYGSTELKNKRMEYWRDMQKLAVLAHQELATEPSIEIANPGGGQHWNTSAVEDAAKGGMASGLAVKPQIGQTPSQMNVVGFHRVDRKNIQPHPEMTVFHAGEVRTAARNRPWVANPVSTIEDEVVTLKSTLESAITAALPVDTEFSIFRIDYSGIIYGDRGYTFP